MPERPIMFSAPMIISLREGHKTQTRRTSGLVAVNTDPDAWKLLGFVEGRGRWWFQNSSLNGIDGSIEIRCPYGIAGDRLWVREAWAIAGARLVDPCLNYRADGAQIPIHKESTPITGTGFSSIRWRGPADTTDSPTLTSIRDGWRPSMFMPRWASRSTLELVSARPERLQSITRCDAIAEGIRVLPLQSADDPSAWWQSAPGVHQERTPQASFAGLWNSINGKKLPWKRNPWLWRVEFKVIV